jgi:hypothetical protein
MMHPPGVKLLIRAAIAKKTQKNTKILLKLFFLPQKVGKVLIAEGFFGVPTA